MAVTGEGNNGGPEDPPSGTGADDERRPTTLRRVEGPIEVVGGPPPISLLREYKGLTVADLLRADIVDRLPGQVRTAMHHLPRGALAAAERSLPGEFAPLLPGPGAARRTPSRFVIWVLVTAVLLAATLASYWF